MKFKNYINLFTLAVQLLLIVSAVDGQSQPPIGLSRWEFLLKDAASRPDSNKVKLLLKITDKAMLRYFNGRETDQLRTVVKLINGLAEISSTIKYTSASKRCMLFKSALLYIQNQDSAASLLHKEAVYSYKNAPIADVADAFYFLSESWKYRRHYQQIVIADSIYYLKALAYFKSIGDDLKTASVARAIAVIHFTKGQFLRAIPELLDLYKFQIKVNDSSRHKTTDFLAHCYAINGNFKEAFFYFQESVKYATEINADIDICLYYYRAGRISYNVHEIDKGTVYLTRALHLAELQRDTSLCIHISFIISREGLIEAGKYQEGLNSMLEIIKKYPDAVKNNNTVNLDILNGLANCYFHLKQYTVAEKYYVQAMNIAEREQGLGLPLHKIPIYQDIGRLYMQQKKMNEAAVYFTKALQLSEKIKSLPNIKKTQLELFKLDSVNGNYLSALKHYQSYKTITDSLFNVAKSKQITELEIQYKIEQKEKEVQLLTNQSQLQQVTIRQGKSFRDAVIAGAVLLLLLLFVLFSRYQVKQRANIQLLAKQEQINLQNASLEQLVMEEKRILSEKDKLLEEKEWLMKEIHHRVKNNLQIVMSLLNSQSAYLKDDAALAAIKESQHRIHAISLIHQKLYQSEDFSLVDVSAYIKEVIEYLADNLDAAHQIEFQFSIEPVELDVAQAVPLGLILNEAVTNAIKYAFPDSRKGKVNIHLQGTFAEGMMLTIQDDGIGLPLDFDWRNTQSLGMTLMKGLCKQLDGQFDITGNNGVTVKIKFMPVQQHVSKAT
jgi:two-component system, sensor histidine kinase PdtaS